MGRIRTKDIKRTARELMEHYGDKFTADYSSNKQVIKDLKIIKTQKVVNKVAGYITRSMKTEKS